MYQSQPGVVEPLAAFRLDGTAIRYSGFVPRLYNLCRELGMQQGLIMPSRAFCSDESQGYPIILIAKHFGTFPFNQGQVGGIVATARTPTTGRTRPSSKPATLDTSLKPAPSATTGGCRQPIGSPPRTAARYVASSAGIGKS